METGVFRKGNKYQAAKKQQMSTVDHQESSSTLLFLSVSNAMNLSHVHTVMAPKGLKLDAPYRAIKE